MTFFAGPFRSRGVNSFKGVNFEPAAWSWKVDRVAAPEMQLFKKSLRGILYVIQFSPSRSFNGIWNADGPVRPARTHPFAAMLARVWR
jgi:hypothetical protein